jgi:hypothetical protein
MHKLTLENSGNLRPSLMPYFINKLRERCLVGLFLSAEDFKKVNLNR